MLPSESELADPLKPIAKSEQTAPVTGIQELSPEGIGLEVKLATGGALLIVTEIGPPGVGPVMSAAFWSTNFELAASRLKERFVTGLRISNATFASRFPLTLAVVVGLIVTAVAGA